MSRPIFPYLPFGMEIALGALLFGAWVGLRILFGVWRAGAGGTPGPDPHAARALEDSFKKKKEKRDRRGVPPADGRQIAGEDCAQCGESIVFESQGTACGVCDALLHLKSCAKRHVCASEEAEAPAPYRS